MYVSFMNIYKNMYKMICSFSREETQLKVIYIYRIYRLMADLRIFCAYQQTIYEALFLHEHHSAALPSSPLAPPFLSSTPHQLLHFFRARAAPMPMPAIGPIMSTTPLLSHAFWMGQTGK